MQDDKSNSEGWDVLSEYKSDQKISITSGSSSHVKAASPILIYIVFIMGGLSALSIIGGVGAIVWNVYSPSVIELFGTTIKTGHVGVAFAGLGLISMVMVIRSILKNLHKLAKLPE